MNTDDDTPAPGKGAKFGPLLPVDAEYVFGLPTLKCELALAFLAGAQMGADAVRAESRKNTPTKP
jgi:hypothetical protein